MAGQRRPLGHTILRFEETGSTNTLALETGEYLENHGLVLLARHQTAGRGRLGRRYASVPGAQLQFSTVIHPQAPPEEIGLVSLAAGLAVAQALEDAAGVRPRLKWPNDVYLNGRKVCGILTEMRTSASGQAQGGGLRLVVGIGINCNGSPEDFPDELQKVLTTVAAERGEPVDPEPILESVLMHLDEGIAALEQGRRAGILQAWRERADLTGRPVRAAQGAGWVEGRAEALTDEGELAIRLNDGRLHLHTAGEVHWLG